MPVDVIMPQMGESIQEGTLVKWLKKAGDTVARDEPLFEISTDKVDAEIPSPAAGVLKEIKVQEGETVAIKTVVATIEAESAAAGKEAAPPQPSAKQGASPQAAAKESTPAAPPSAETPAAPAKEEKPEEASARGDGPAKGEGRANEQGSREETPAPQREPARGAPAPAAPAGSASSSGAASGSARSASGPATSGGGARPAPATSSPGGGTVTLLEERLRTRSSPVVRKIAAENGVEISGLQGSGISGRVTKKDIVGFLETREEAPASAPAPAAAPGGTPAPAAAVAAEAARIAPSHVSGERFERVPMTTMRRKIAEHMIMSRRTSAHVTTVFEIDMTRIAKIREAKKAAFQERHGVNLTYMPFIMKATVDALMAFPALNASIDGTDVLYKKDINLGIAVALDWGLIVPVVKNAQDLSLSGLSKAINDLSTRARSKQLKPEEVQGGTFTITNPGVFGSLFGTPIISQPQVAILGVGTIEKRPAVIDDAIAIRTMAYFAISFDHRLIDGAVADQFMARLKKTLQEFDEASV